jgi:hypothetical protein
LITYRGSSPYIPDDFTRLLKKYNTPEQRKSAAAANEQDSTTRPPSRMELQMKPPAETPATFPVK